MAFAESGPSLLTLGIMFSGDRSFTNSLSSVKLQCSLYGTSYLDNRGAKSLISHIIRVVINNIPKNFGFCKHQVKHLYSLWTDKTCGSTGIRNAMQFFKCLTRQISIEEKFCCSQLEFGKGFYQERINYLYSWNQN